MKLRGGSMEAAEVLEPPEVSAEKSVEVEAIAKEGKIEEEESLEEVIEDKTPKEELQSEPQSSEPKPITAKATSSRFGNWTWTPPRKKKEEGNEEEDAEEEETKPKEHKPKRRGKAKGLAARELAEERMRRSRDKRDAAEVLRTGFQDFRAEPSPGTLSEALENRTAMQLAIAKALSATTASGPFRAAVMVKEWLANAGPDERIEAINIVVKAATGIPANIAEYSVPKMFYMGEHPNFSLLALIGHMLFHYGNEAVGEANLAMYRRSCGIPEGSTLAKFKREKIKPTRAKCLKKYAHLIETERLSHEAAEEFVSNFVISE